MTDEIENEITQITVSEGQARQPGIAAGEFIIEDLPPIELGRIAAQTAKQVIVQKVREAERQRQYREYQDRSGEIVNTSFALAKSRCPARRSPRRSWC